ncbi:MAG TPA: hypothetical protein DEB17_11250 [Chlorobaculum sp.]|uniref:Uncharacterized protein n=1 Tax=Chlorobaculum tepidum (strain ATCC 49652 / DSM 12025 / NBRC 103806 / TLS) TaxID=194439 RepID=Q8KCP3_CHLTE|nr:hypothetical protein CT1370 [Chlorobaculum tepidum TLS]HBU24543.1 hypothetical protein [Chlorobaculum sp.]
MRISVRFIMLLHGERWRFRKMSMDGSEREALLSTSSI